MIDYVRKKLVPWFNIADLEYLERYFELAGEHELAKWIKRLWQERQTLN
jgi:hypothetical protein